jgi:hypothetical protein
MPVRALLPAHHDHRDGGVMVSRLPKSRILTDGAIVVEIADWLTALRTSAQIFMAEIDWWNLERQPECSAGKVVAIRLAGGAQQVEPYVLFPVGTSSPK